MTPLLLPVPKNLGTAYAESMHSLVARTAATYRVSLHKCLRLAVCAGADQHVDLSSYKTLKEWVGQGSLCARLADGLQVLSGRVDIRRTTLQNLGLGQSRWLVSDRLRLCPTCMHPERGVGYSMLVHQLRHVHQCPLHRSRLIDRCVCGAFFGLRQIDVMGRVCPRCNAKLWASNTASEQVEPFAAWREQQMFDLVEYATSSDELVPANDWVARFHLGIERLMCSLEQYTHAERSLIRAISKRSKKNADVRPSLNTLLGLSVMQAKGVVDILRAPDVVLTPRLLDIGGVDVERDKRRTLSRPALNRAKKLLEDLLNLPAQAELPSVRSLMRHESVESVQIWRADRTLLARYQNERRRRNDRIKSRTQRKTLFAARRLVEERLAHAVVPEIRRDGAQLMISTGATKEVAEEALRSVLLGWSVIIDELTSKQISASTEVRMAID